MPGTSVVPYRDQYAGAVSAAGATGRDANADYLARLRAFDPLAFLRDANSAAVSDALEQYSTNDAVRRNGLSASGFSPAGPGGTGVINRDLNERVARSIAANSFRAADLQQRNTEDIGQYGDRQSSYYYDLLAGGLDREQAEKNAKKSRWSSLAGGLGALAGGAIGTFLLPGIGTELGASLGGGLGKGIGGMA